MSTPTRGMLLGKFMPPHLGHVYLAEFAQRFVDELVVVVGSLAREPIPGAQRYAWMRELLPSAHVVHLTDELPQEPAEHPDFWRLWHDALRRVMPFAPDLVFASEPYGKPLARVLSARFVPVDLARDALPVSGTAVRDDPAAQWPFVPRCVRPWFARRVCVVGPESSGKTTLARALGAHYGTTVVPEYARAWLEARGGAIDAADIDPIARGQIASEDALARNAARPLLVCDTDALTTVLWSELLFDGACPAWLRAAADHRDYDLYLLCAPDLPFVPDPVRYRPDAREAFFARLESELRARGRRYVVVRGTEPAMRLAAATRAIDALCAEPARRDGLARP